MSMDIYILVWDKLKMYGGIILIKSILSLTLMVVSPVAMLNTIKTTYVDEYLNPGLGQALKNMVRLK
jgi:hypothetical protein